MPRASNLLIYLSIILWKLCSEHPPCHPTYHKVTNKPGSVLIVTEISWRLRSWRANEERERLNHSRKDLETKTENGKGGLEVNSLPQLLSGKDKVESTIQKRQTGLEPVWAQEISKPYPTALSFRGNPKHVAVPLQSSSEDSGQAVVHTGLTGALACEGRAEG